MYTRHKGDDLLSKDNRLKYKWKWCRVASQIDEEDIKKWTYFQISHCRLNDWELEATQWGSGYNEPVYYSASIYYIGLKISSIEGFKTRIEAQIGAEKLLHKWIKTEYLKLKKTSGGL